MDPKSIFEHTLDKVGGFRNDQTQLSFSAPLHSTVTIMAYEGRIVSRHGTSGGFQMGCFADRMAFVLDAPTTPYNADVDATGRWKAYAPMNIRAAYPVTCALELQTTEYDDAKTYAIDNYLTARTGDTDQTNGGILTNTAAGSTALTLPERGSGTTRTIVGMVSRLPNTLRTQNKVLAFFTLFRPGSTNSTSSD